VAYRVTFVPAAAKQLRKLAKSTQGRLVAAIELLAADPRPNGVKKLSGPEGFLRVRVGDYRIVYTVNDDLQVLEIVIVRIGHRREVYRFLRG